jgi:hypothetical protein
MMGVREPGWVSPRADLRSVAQPVVMLVTMSAMLLLEQGPREQRPFNQVSTGVTTELDPAKKTWSRPLGLRQSDSELAATPRIVLWHSVETPLCATGWSDHFVLRTADRRT